MKSRFILFILLASQVILAQPGGLNIKNYKINAKLDLSARQLFVEARLTIQKNDSAETLPFLLSSFANITSLVSGNHTKIPFHFSGKDTLSVSLPEPLKNDKKITLSFTYILPADSFAVKRGMMVMKRSERWYPLQVGGLFKADLRITVPNNQVTVSNGTCMRKFRTDGTVTFEWNTTHAYNIALFVFNPDSMECRSEVVAGTRISYYFVPGLKDEQKIMSQVKNSFAFYSGFLGRYQQDNYTVIEIPSDDFLGQGLQSMLLFTPKLLEYIPDPGLWVPHEVGHQWFGNTVSTDEQAPGRWFVEESIDEYLKAMYVEHLYGPDSLRHMLKDFYLANYHAVVKNGKDVAIMDVVSVNNSNEEAQTIYAKGPLVLHQLRRCMGDDNWNNMIKKIYRDFQKSLFTLEDFKIYISKYDHGGKCPGLFNDLLSSKGIPEGLRFD